MGQKALINAVRLTQAMCRYAVRKRSVQIGGGAKDSTSAVEYEINRMIRRC
jgi:hypothetical protein